MTEREPKSPVADRFVRVLRQAQMQSDHEPAPVPEPTYEDVIDALCGAAGRIVNVSFAADGEPILTEYP
jgi:hypothetical protein